MNKTGFGERFRYWFDGVMSKGTIAIIGLLALVTVAFIAVIAAVVAIFRLGPEGDPEMSFSEAMWGSLMRTLDSGTMGGDAGTGYRVLMLIVTIGGVVVVASLIGIISGAFDSKVEDLRKGRSKVLENDHTLILGWSSKVFPIVSELVVANESRKRPVVVILADRDKVEMEDELRAQLPATGKTRIIVRSGDPMNLRDLEISNPHTARSIIILAEEVGDDPDAIVIKTALALTNNPNRKAGDYHIVGEVQEPASMEAARLVGRHEAHWVLASDLISRITVQSCRQSGLSVVYTELLDFDGDEIYFSRQPELVGKSYFAAQLSFSDSSVIGLVKGGAVMINPDADTVVESGDELILIAEDDSAIRVSAPAAADIAAIAPFTALTHAPERTLVLGFNAGLHAMVRELSEYVAFGSEVVVVADVETPEFEQFRNMAVRFTRADATNRAVLDALEVAGFDHVIVLAYKETLDTQRADAKTLITLLQLRDIEEKAGIDLNIVSEMLDDRNRELAEVTKADDFIVSDKLISLMLSQVSENKQLTEVFETLFSSAGSEVYLRPFENYIVAGAEVDFYTVLEAARQRGETAIGYRSAARSRSAADAYGVTINPRKHDAIRFAAGDKIIVLAED
ncbi:voltage-gated potassium channel Kch [Conyzicola nivalis]|uniref:Voltage-gated potassium channel Kch n=1 Tax=Conyzicola nivalis TaxID=1477021 RepID=A0ABV2QL46_9MICO